MNAELEIKLLEKYPKIFKNRNASPSESPMCWGLEVGDGWYELLDILCEALTYTFTTSIEVTEEDGERLGVEPYLFQNKKSYFFKVEPPQVVADQVKEKFGTLRFYYHLEYDPANIQLVETGKYPNLVEINKRYSDYLDGTVHFAEIASSRTCEITGAEGKIHSRRGWLKVINENLTKEEKYKDYRPI